MTEPFLSRIRPENPSDPLLRQVLPVVDEDASPAGFSADPLLELNANPRPGLLQKYRGRALLITTGACGIHCRYCFRRHFPYQESPKSVADWEPAIEALASETGIEEVLLSGGDPLMLVDASFDALVRRLEQIPQLKRLRIHTRMPIVVPARVNSAFVDTLTSTRLKTTIVIHANHANELDSEVAAALSILGNAASFTLNQSVLLRGVNDSVEALVSLSQRLIECDVIPYYLHQLDRVQGAAHFEVPIETGKSLIEAMRARLPGYAVPRYVQEVAGEPNKTVLA